MQMSEIFGGGAIEQARILVVDDEILNVNLLVTLLGRADLGEIKGLTESREVLDAVTAFDPDVILLDLHMPAPDGWTLLDKIKRITPDDVYRPVIVLTADVADETRDRALSMGAADFLTKPLSAIEVVLRVKNQLRIRLLTEQLRRKTAMLGSEVEDGESADAETKERLRRISQIANDAEAILTMVYQPIVNFDSGLVTGVEALARFNVVPLRPPNEWFADAVEAGVDVRLEIAAIRKAISEADQLPVHAHLSVNASPAAIRSGALLDLVAGGCVRPLVIEVTERDKVEDFGPLSDAMRRLSRHGVRFAVDDTGTGFVSLSHLSALRPDMIKLDRQLVAAIHDDPVRRALVGALVGFAAETGSKIIALGIECAEELETLHALGVTLGQGYFLGRPDHLPLPEVIDVSNPPGASFPAVGRVG